MCDYITQLKVNSPNLGSSILLRILHTISTHSSQLGVNSFEENVRFQHFTWKILPEMKMDASVCRIGNDKNPNTIKIGEIAQQHSGQAVVSSDRWDREQSADNTGDWWNTGQWSPVGCRTLPS